MREHKSRDLRHNLAVSSGPGCHQALQSLWAFPSARARASPVTAALSTVTAFPLAQSPASAPLGCGCSPLPSSGWARHQACTPSQQLCPSQKLQKDSKGLGGSPGWGNSPYLPLSPGAKQPQVGRYSTSAHPKHTHRSWALQLPQQSINPKMCLYLPLPAWEQFLSLCCSDTEAPSQSDGTGPSSQLVSLSFSSPARPGPAP